MSRPSGRYWPVTVPGYVLFSGSRVNVNGACLDAVAGWKENVVRTRTRTRSQGDAGGDSGGVGGGVVHRQSRQQQQ